MAFAYDITFHPSWWHRNAGIDFVQEFFDEPEYRLDCDLKMRRALYDHFGDYGIGEKNPARRPILGTDLLAAGYLYSELFGCGIRYEPDNSPQVLCAGLDEAVIEKVECPDLATSEVWARTQRQIDYLQTKYGHVEAQVNLMGIQNILLDLMGSDGLMAYYSAPEAVRTLLTKITDLSLELGRRFYALSSDVSGGVTRIVEQVAPGNYLTSNCSVEMVSNKIYEKFLLEHDQRLAQAFPNFGIHHCGKTMEHVVNGYAKIPQLTFAEVGAGSDIRAVRAVLPTVFLNARYSPVRLRGVTADEVYADVRDLITGGHDASGGGVSISCVGIDADVTDEQIRFFLDACKSLGA
ncbi:MAG: hypothetical protein MJ249_09455 [Kiritimatiellae bacterium]|nr:hypothetical protein [Kiritimatiellia bacterium]